MQTEQMTKERAERILAKCLKLYDRTRSKRKLQSFVDRIDGPGYEVLNLMQERIEPEIRQRYFPDLTVEKHLEKVMARCRAVDRPALLLSRIWRELDNELFFDAEEYGEFVERFEEEVNKLPNPPTRQDWDDLEEELMK